LLHYLRDRKGEGVKKTDNLFDRRGGRTGRRRALVGDAGDGGKEEDRKKKKKKNTYSRNPCTKKKKKKLEPAEGQKPWPGLSCMWGKGLELTCDLGRKGRPLRTRKGGIASGPPRA